MTGTASSAAVATRAGPVPSDDSRVSTALRRAQASVPVRMRELADWLAIPSVSGRAAHEADLQRAARFLENHLRRVGAATALLATAGPPVVIGCVSGPLGSPVVVLYGHYDVQPAGPGWTSPAFQPGLRRGSLMARGANDDKGQLFAVIAALRAWHESGGVPSTVVVIGEGAEEVGSPGLGKALATVAKRVKPDVVLACDTERAADGVPAVTISQRGHVALLVQVDVGGQPVHAGRLGGAVVDPSMALAQVLARMQAAMLAATKTPQRELDPARKSGLAVQSLRNSTIRRLAGGRATRSGSLERRTTAEPAFHVVQLRAGAGRAAVPSRAEARLDVRLPAEADPRAVASHLARVARASAPVGVVVQVTPGAMSPGYAALPRQEVLMAVDDACGAVYGRPLALVRSGGTLPAARLLADSFGLAPVLLGLGTPGGGAHGPDERLDVAGWAQAVRLLVRLLARPIAKATTDDRRGSQRRHSQRQSKTYTMGCPCDNASRQRVWRLYDLPSAAQLDRSLKRPPVGRAAT